METAPGKCPCRDAKLVISMKVSGSVGSITAVHEVDLHTTAHCSRCGRVVKVSRAMVKKLINESFKG